MRLRHVCAYCDCVWGVRVCYLWVCVWTVCIDVCVWAVHTMWRCTIRILAEKEPAGVALLSLLIHSLAPPTTDTSLCFFLSPAIRTLSPSLSVSSLSLFSVFSFSIHLSLFLYLCLRRCLCVSLLSLSPFLSFFVSFPLRLCLSLLSLSLSIDVPQIAARTHCTRRCCMKCAWM